MVNFPNLKNFIKGGGGQLCNKSGYSCYGIGLDAMSQLSLSNELDTWSRDVNMDFKKGDCLFGAVKLTKNADHNKYGYSG